MVGGPSMEEITRDAAVECCNWWMERMIAAEDGGKPVKPNTVKHHIGNMRTFYEVYFTNIGQGERLHPLRKIFVKDKSRTEAPAFEGAWVRKKILVSGLFYRLNNELRTIINILIETNCWTGEVVNLRPADIRVRH